MKLLQILARELEEWPDDVSAMVQDHDIKDFLKPRMIVIGVWCGSDLATDHATAIVTRADWEAERAKLKAPKANGDGWVRHRGRKMPVSEGTRVDVKHRDGCIYHCLPAGEGMAANWGHSKHPEDIMQYRLSAAKKQPSPKLERALTQAEEIRIKAHQADAMLAIRDRIRELDTQREEVESTYQRQISEITQERESLVQKLAGEGLALVEVVVQPVEDMSDWRNWKAGDVLECTGSKSSHFTDGLLYKFVKISFELGSARAIDNRGIENGLLPKFFKWHSRPAS